MNNCLRNKLESEAHYIQILIPYDKNDELITFDNGVMIELECDEDFSPPMLNKETSFLEFTIDLKECKALNWNYENGYLRMWAKVRDSGIYTLLNSAKEPIWQIKGYVPNKLIPPFEKGYGDYIELEIEENATVANWPKSLDFTDFIEEGMPPQPIKTNKWHRAQNALWEVKRLELDKEEIQWLIDELKRTIN